MSRLLCTAFLLILLPVAAVVEEVEPAVASRAHSTQGIKNAMLAGVASIEHGTALDDEAIAMMKKNDVYLVSDLYADEFVACRDGP